MQSHLITGGAGFIGSHLVDALLARGDRVVALDDLSTGSLRNLQSIPRHDTFRFVHGSVSDEVLVDELVSKSDVVVHLAAAVGVRLVLARPLHSLTTEIRGFETVIQAAHRHRRRVVVASTSEVYGKTAVPLSEDSGRLLGPTSVARWGYGTAKALVETLAFAYHREEGLPVTVVRLFNTGGPRQSPATGMVIPRLARQAVGSEPLTVYGDGRQTRCFCHVLDVVDAIVRLLDDDRSHGEAYNIGSEEEIAIVDLACRIAGLASSGSAVRLVPYADVYGAGFEDVQRRVPDIGKIRALTGWRPTLRLDQILSEAVAEAQSQHVAATS